MAKTRGEHAGQMFSPEDIDVRKNLTPLDPTIPPKLRPRTVIDIKTPRGPTKRVTDRVSAEDTMNDIGMRKSAGTRDDDAPNGNVEVGPITPMKKGGKVKAPKKFSRGGGIEVRGKTKGRFV